MVADDGEVVAFCTAWIDDERGIGLMEPVGTRPAYQRRGLARAVCLSALAALRNAGAHTAQIGYATAAALTLYRSIGFEPLAADPEYRRPHLMP